MKRCSLLLLMVFTGMALVASAQSESFRTLKTRFSDDENVHCFALSGLFCRAALWAAGDWEFREAVSDVSSIRLISIPKEHFASKDLSVRGFRKYLQKDHFVSLVNIRDKGEFVEIYVQEHGNKSNRYLVLVEEEDEVTVVEIKGNIDFQKIKEIEKRNELSYQP